MSRLRVYVILGVILVVMVIGSVGQSSAAAPVCGPRDDPSTCTPAFAPNQQLAIKSGVPFVWLRKGATSSAAVAHTVNNSSNARFIIEYSPSIYDGYQNWWLVHLVSDKSKAGMVEQSSLVDGGVPTGTKAPWKASFIGGVRAGLPFIWMRSQPFSNAKVVATIRPGNTFTVSIELLPAHDGTQWWWYVRTKMESGYVEQNSIVPVRLIPATSVPLPVPTTPPNAPPHVVWKEGTFFSAIKPGVPFISVRTVPNSTAPILYNLIPGDPFSILIHDEPAYDGRQWWWQVTAPTSNPLRSGWVEEASLVQTADDPPTATIDSNAAQPTCGTMTVSPATFIPPVPPSVGGGIYYIVPGSTITFDVEGLANLASITFNVPGPNENVWTASTSPRKLDFPGSKSEVTAVVPQAGGWTAVSAQAIGLNGENIACGGFTLENASETGTPPSAAADANVPAATRDPSS